MESTGQCYSQKSSGVATGTYCIIWQSRLSLQNLWKSRESGQRLWVFKTKKDVFSGQSIVKWIRADRVSIKNGNRRGGKGVTAKITGMPAFNDTIITRKWVFKLPTLFLEKNYGKPGNVDTNQANFALKTMATTGIIGIIKGISYKIFRAMRPPPDGKISRTFTGTIAPLNALFLYYNCCKS